MAKHLSREGLVQYGARFEHLNFMKRQQWAISYYLLLVYAAVFGVGRALGVLVSWEKYWGIGIIVIAGFVGVVFLVLTQCDMEDTRKSLERVKKECFTPTDRGTLGSSRSCLPSWLPRRLLSCLEWLRRCWITIMLMSVATIGAVVASYALCRLPECP